MGRSNASAKVRGLFAVSQDLWEYSTILPSNASLLLALGHLRSGECLHRMFHVSMIGMIEALARARRNSNVSAKVSGLFAILQNCGGIEVIQLS